MAYIGKDGKVHSAGMTFVNTQTGKEHHVMDAFGTEEEVRKRYDIGPEWQLIKTGGKTMNERERYNKLKEQLANETDPKKRAKIEAAMKKLEPYVKTSENVAKASAATQAPLNSDRDVSMASKDPVVSKIVDADKKRDAAKMKDKSDPRNQAAVHRAEADVIDANTDAQEALQKTEIETLHDKLINAKLSEADLKRIYELWKAGKWPYGIGSKTMEWFKKLGLVDPKPTDGPKPGTSTDIDRTSELKPLKPLNQNKPSKGFSQWLASEARLYWDLKGQIRAGKKMDDEAAKKETMRIMRKMYSMGTGASTTSLRSLQATEGLSDISGDMRSDASVARSIAKAWKKNANGDYSPALYDE